VLDQINKLREDVALKENELKEANRQLQKLEAARKVLGTGVNTQNPSGPFCSAVHLRK